MTESTFVPKFVSYPGMPLPEFFKVNCKSLLPFSVFLAEQRLLTGSRDSYYRFDARPGEAVLDVERNEDGLHSLACIESIMGPADESCELSESVGRYCWVSP